MKRILALGALVGALIGCTDRHPMAIDAVPAPIEASVSSEARSEARTAVLENIDDVLERVLPALTNQQRVRPLEAALNGLRNAIGNANDNGLAAQVSAVRNAIERYADAHPDDAADLDVIHLLLDHAEPLAVAGQ